MSSPDNRLRPETKRRTVVLPAPEGPKTAVMPRSGASKAISIVNLPTFPLNLAMIFEARCIMLFEPSASQAALRRGSRQMKRKAFLRPGRALESIAGRPRNHKSRSRALSCGPEYCRRSSKPRQILPRCEQTPAQLLLKILVEQAARQHSRTYQTDGLEVSLQLRADARQKPRTHCEWAERRRAWSKGRSRISALRR